MMKFISTEIPGVVIIEPVVFGDDRGFFFESYRKDIFKENGIDVEFVQDNHSLSQKGVLRGLHYQIAPKAQAKLVRVVHGRAFDVAVDIRKNSSTFGKCVTAILSAKDKKMMYIPAGFAHGFCALEDGTEFLYKTSEVYSPEHERGIVWNDPELGIAWPALDTPYLFSKKDQSYPVFKKALL
jgi:dTDP-4-dehydrorhamnose 3,5-epimerase